ncbi:MAG: hypothetical protein QOG94_262 [Solirubrobacteraceae bacterium]|jgi:hypothetical protein|nr:hypothetical protein [Solirubrobacteraceae bacterium]MEA2139848.1 hypothetical protein [Solirubrobacteraceae bacterium]
MLHRMLVAVALATVAAVTPLAAAQGATTKAKAAPGVFFGGVTAARYPVVIQLSKTGKKVVRASIGLELTCEMPGDLTLPDSFKDLPISKAGKFSNSYQETPDTVPDPATGISKIQFSGSITGKLNAAKTTIKGTWSQKIVAYSAADPTGATVLYTCDSGAVNYTAKQ